MRRARDERSHDVKRETTALWLLLPAAVLVDASEAFVGPVRAGAYDAIPHVAEARFMFGCLALVAWAVGGVIVHAHGPRVAVVAGFAAFVIANAFALYAHPFEAFWVGYFAAAAWTVGVATFAAQLATGEPPTPRRFTVLAAFLLARVAFVPIVWLEIMKQGFADAPEEPRSTMALLVLAAGAIPLASALLAGGPRASVAPALHHGASAYRTAPASLRETADETGSSPGEAIDGTLSARLAWVPGLARALVPLLLPATYLAIFSAIDPDHGRRPVEQWCVPIAATLALGFLIAAARRSPLSPLVVLGLLLVAVGAGVQALPFVGDLPVSFDPMGPIRATQAAAGAIGLSYAALAVRDRRAGLVVAAWCATTAAATFVLGRVGVLAGFLWLCIPISIIALGIFTAVYSKRTSKFS